MNVHIRLESTIQLDAGVLSAHVTASVDLNIGSVSPECTDEEVTFIERVNTHPVAITDVPPIPPAIRVGRMV